MLSDKIWEFPCEKQIGERTFILDIAQDSNQLDQVFRLRYRIFNQELKEGLASSEATGRDEDRFDEFCDHLLIIDKQTEQIVGTYRLNPYFKAKAGYGYYSSTEFDIKNITTPNIKLLEVGRACIEPAYRDGSVMTVLWYGLARYIKIHDLEYLCGCASLEKSASAEFASKVFAYAREKNLLMPAEFEIYPLSDNQVLGFDPNYQIEDMLSVKKNLPPLFKGYFAINTKIAGYPAYDPDFNVIDFFMMFDAKELDSGPSKRFLL